MNPVGAIGAHHRVDDTIGSTPLHWAEMVNCGVAFASAAFTDAFSGGSVLYLMKSRQFGSSPWILSLSNTRHPTARRIATHVGI